MFLDNKYAKIYFSIIDRAKNSNRSKLEDYYEVHHIIPTCIRITEETVLLTAREHYICHLLLPKMVEVNTEVYWKLRYAISMFVRNPQGNERLNSRQFEQVRKITAANSSHLNRGRKYKHQNQSARKGMSWINDGKIETYGHFDNVPLGFERGRLRFSKDHVKRMTVGLIEHNKSTEFREKQAARMREIMKKNNVSKREDVRRKISESRIGKSFIHVTRNRENRCVQAEQLDEFLIDGWIRGRYIKSRRKKNSTNHETHVD